MSKIIFNLSLSIIIFLLVGCVGSPLHTSSKSSTELRYVDDHTLCKAYTPREMYSPSASVIYEVRRRGLNCSTIYSYSGTGSLDRTIRVLQGIQNQQQTRNARGVALYSREYRSGLNKICVYNRLGSGEAYTFKATDICPLSIP